MSLDQFITSLLNIKSDEIQEIYHLKPSDDSLMIKLKIKRTLFSCPYCKRKLNIHSYYTRKLIHSTFANRKCSIHYMQRRYKCENCEITLHEHNPFSSLRENITHETKINVLTDLKYPEATYTSVAYRYNLSVTQVIRIFDRHVDIPRSSLLEVLSMDEHYFPESDYDSLYCCLLMNFITGEIIDILPDRKKSYLTHYFSRIKHDTFDYATSKSELDNEPRYNKRLGEYINYRGIRDLLLSEFPELKVAYELRNYYIDLNSDRTIQEAPQKIDQAIKLFADSGITESDEFHNLLMNWHDEIINSFNTINGWRINNSYIESKNRILEKIIYQWLHKL